MATKFATGEVLVLATEDDCSGRSNSENRESIGLEDVGAVMGEAIPGPCSFYTRRIS